LWRRQIGASKRAAPVPPLIAGLFNREEPDDKDVTSPGAPGSARRACSIQIIRRALRPTTEPACDDHDDQHQKNEPAKTTAYCRATQVKPAAAEQKQKDYQQNYEIHCVLLSGFGDSIVPRP